MESRFGSLLAPSAPATMRLDERHATVGLSPRALIAQKIAKGLCSCKLFDTLEVASASGADLMNTM